MAGYVPSIPEIIAKKRDGRELDDSEIEHFITAVTNGSIEQSQIGAMLMAIYLRGLSVAETIVLTRCMTYSGDTLKFPEEWTPLLIDKHSTGGVGDKISLVLAPVLASLGFKVPMVSGRGLGFTGGTLDKLESLPGFRTALNNEEMTRCLDRAGCFIGSAGLALAPADGILYKQRDITSTVACMPLIVSSILSKKVAEGTKSLVMDVKVGKGSFMKNEKDANTLAQLLVEISKGLNVKTKAVLSRMDQPIGRSIGNSLEVLEALQCLKNDGPEDVNELVETLGAVLLECNGKVETLTEGKELIRNTISSGSALKSFKIMIVEQGVSEVFADGFCSGNPNFALSTAQYKTNVLIDESGFISDIDALELATCCWHLGAGRSNASDPIDHSVGLTLLKVVGNAVHIGEIWLVVHHSTETLPATLLNQLKNSIKISGSKPDRQPLIMKIY